MRGRRLTPYLLLLAFILGAASLAGPFSHTSGFSAPVAFVYWLILSDMSDSIRTPDNILLLLPTGMFLLTFVTLAMRWVPLRGRARLLALIPAVILLSIWGVPIANSIGTPPQVGGTGGYAWGFFALGAAHTLAAMAWLEKALVPIVSTAAGGFPVVIREISIDK